MAVAVSYIRESKKVKAETLTFSFLTQETFEEFLGTFFFRIFKDLFWATLFSDYPFIHEDDTV